MFKVARPKFSKDMFPDAYVREAVDNLTFRAEEAEVDVPSAILALIVIRGERVKVFVCVSWGDVAATLGGSSADHSTSPSTGWSLL